MLRHTAHYSHVATCAPSDVAGDVTPAAPVPLHLPPAPELARHSKGKGVITPYAIHISDDPSLITSVNRGAFLGWLIRTLDQKEQSRVHDALPIVVHRSGGPTQLPGISIGGIVHTVPAVPCDVQPCHRCDNLRGGYHFRFVGPWTTEKCYDLL